MKIRLWLKLNTAFIQPKCLAEELDCLVSFAEFSICCRGSSIYHIITEYQSRFGFTLFFERNVVSRMLRYYLRWQNASNDFVLLN